ncbi:hypothetical protein [Litchfieldella rifensis]|uniref:LAGLIDADG homing endonuclease n=1 Tax=Litchfieldella rifensis TaxID=762643 RepID=A0ABV7LJ72_9GAMM
MPVVGECALCNAQSVKLQNSHIVPELCYKPVYPKKHNKYKAFGLDNNESLKEEQKGYREYLLCKCCEVKLSVWENKLKQLLWCLAGKSGSSGLALDKIGTTSSVSNLAYDDIKKGVLSIFWRMSVTHLPFFSDYSLGPYEAKLKSLIFSPVSIAEDEYPILMTKCLLNGSFHDGILMPMKKGRLSNHITIQSVILNGVMIDAYITDSNKPHKAVKSFMLRSTGTILVPEREYLESGIEVSKLKKRLTENDALEFYNDSKT